LDTDRIPDANAIAGHGIAAQSVEALRARNPARSKKDPGGLLPPGGGGRQFLCSQKR
jgi:hypothetical protein